MIFTQSNPRLLKRNSLALPGIKTVFSESKHSSLDHFFEKILGSPTEKKDNIAALLSDLNWQHSKPLYVGDSNNDLEAAKANNLDFVGRCSGLIDWENFDTKFVPDLSSLHKVLQ